MMNSVLVRRGVHPTREDTGEWPRINGEKMKRLRREKYKLSTVNRVMVPNGLRKTSLE